MKNFTLTLAAAVFAAMTSLAAPRTIDANALNAPANALEDYGIITEQPAGELRTYDRSGYAYYVVNDYVRRGAQTGTIDIVFADGNKVYLKDPLSKLIVNTWVEGTLSDDGKTITLPMNQNIQYDTEVNQPIAIKMMSYDEDYEEMEVLSTAQVTYTITEDKITLNGTGKYLCMGAVWTTSNEWAGFADYNSVYTPAITDELVEVPDGLTSDVYKFKGDEYQGGELNYNSNVAFDGNDVYVQGILADMPNAWIKGTRNGSTVTFASGQYLGLLANKPVYMMAVNRMNTSEIQDLVLNYDEVNEKFSNDSQFLLLNSSKSTVYLMQAISDFTLTKSKTGVAYEVPYLESFGSASSMNEYTIIDSNNDGTTWGYNSMSGYVNYNWSMTNAADEWLITPAIHLLAGESYVFSLNARSFTATYPERFEVMLGNAATVEAMTTSVIPQTEVATGTFTKYEANVTVPEEGNYYFGIHAISDADNMMLAVDDIAVDEGKATGIATVTASNIAKDDVVYSVDGMVMGKSTIGLPKGIYIQNGKKIVVK